MLLVNKNTPDTEMTSNGRWMLRDKKSLDERDYMRAEAYGSMTSRGKSSSVSCWKTTSNWKMASRETFLCLMACVLGFTTRRGNAEMHDFCAWETFNGSCSADEVIVIDGARYGRMQHSRCVRHDLGFVGCFKDVLDLADSMCSGQRRCEIRVPSPDLDKTEPCLQDIKSYLAIGYSCKKETTNCRVARAAKLTQVHGFLSNLVTAETGCGSVVSPWLIEAKSGQRVNVTLWNFAMDKAGDLARSLGANSCLKYAILTETDKKHHKVVCGDFSRISHVYTSVGSSLDVRIQGLPSSSSTGPYFLLEYQIIGCVDPVIGDDLWYRRQGATATVGCDTGSETWTMECRGTTWIGEFGTCSRKTVSEYGFRFPSALSVVIVITISLLIGLLILSLGLLYLCRRQRNNGAAGDPRHPATLLDGTDHMIYNPRPIPKYVTEHSPPLPTDSMQQHSYERESNDYASIWEWPLPYPPPSVATAAGSPEGHLPEPYQGRLSSTSPDKPEHPYQLPAIQVAGYPAHRVRAREDCHVIDPRYFELDPSSRQRSSHQGDAETEMTQGTAEADDVSCASMKASNQPNDNRYT